MQVQGTLVRNSGTDRQEADNLIEKHKIEIKVLGIANTRKMLLANGSPVDIAGWKDQLEEKGLQADLKTFIQEVKIRITQYCIYR